MHVPAAGDFRQHMIEYIRRHFKDLLGEHLALLDQADGLERLSALVRDGAVRAARSR